MFTSPNIRKLPLNRTAIKTRSSAVKEQKQSSQSEISVFSPIPLTVRDALQELPKDELHYASGRIDPSSYAFVTVNCKLFLWKTISDSPFSTEDCEQISLPYSSLGYPENLIGLSVSSEGVEIVALNAEGTGKVFRRELMKGVEEFDIELKREIACVCAISDREYIIACANGVLLHLSTHSGIQFYAFYSPTSFLSGFVGMIWSSGTTATSQMKILKFSSR